jgi:hypothetical protein
MVNGVPQNSVTRRALRNQNLVAGPFLNRYPADVWNTNNAARNVLEIIADQARNDAGGDYKIRIYTIGMGELVRYDTGTLGEKAEDILKRISNDPLSGPQPTPSSTANTSSPRQKLTWLLRSRDSEPNSALEQVGQRQHEDAHDQRLREMVCRGHYAENEISDDFSSGRG